MRKNDQLTRAHVFIFSSQIYFTSQSLKRIFENNWYTRNWKSHLYNPLTTVTSVSVISFFCGNCKFQICFLWLLWPFVSTSSEFTIYISVDGTISHVSAFFVCSTPINIINRAIVCIWGNLFLSIWQHSVSLSVLVLHL